MNTSIPSSEDLTDRRQPRSRKLTLVVAMTLIAIFCASAAVPIANAQSAELAAKKKKKPAPNPCAATIGSCGCTILTPGFYDVVSALNLTKANSDGSCIAISAPNTVLFLNGNKITGTMGAGVCSPGNLTGIGIHLSASAKGSFIEGSSQILPTATATATSVATPAPTPTAASTSTAAATPTAAPTPTPVLSLISGMSYGIMDEAGNVTIEHVQTDCNSTAGILVQKASSVQVINNVANGNGNYGIWLNTVAGSSVANTSLGATRQPDPVSGVTNGIAGLLVGCGIGAAPCGPGTSTGNRIFNVVAVGNSAAIGIAVQLNAHRNIITNNIATGNKKDLEDFNNDCDANLWFANLFLTSDPSTCIN